MEEKKQHSHQHNLQNFEIAGAIVVIAIATMYKLLAICLRL